MEVNALRWGVIDISVTVADTCGFLEELKNGNILIFQVATFDEITLQFTTAIRNLKKIQDICHTVGAEYKVISISGILFLLRKVVSRPVLLIGFMLWFLLVIYLPSRVLFVHVEGHRNVPQHLIIEKAEKCGVAFGSARRMIRSEEVKNVLLSELPELQWVGVNTYGCLAVISVQERSSPETVEKTMHVGHIVATHDGIVSRLLITKGTALCTVGEAVTKGQVLVSGYSDLGLVLRAETATAEVFGLTERKITSKVLQSCSIRNKIIDRRTDYSIQIGKNVVKLSNRAGIPDGSCVKIYERKYLLLPGGFQLPIALICEKVVAYDLESATLQIEEQEFQSLMDEYLLYQTLMGRILSSGYQRLPSDNFYAFQGVYICEEMIGKLRKEEIEK